MKFENCRKNGRTYVIAELSGNHGGDYNKALDILHAAYDAGADCFKTQTYTADTLTLNCSNAGFVVHGGLWDGRKLYDLYSEGATPWEWQEKLKAECDKIGMDFMSSPFDKTAVDYLESIGCEYYKIASPELVDIPLIEYVAKTKKTMFISTGMSNKEEIGDAVNAVKGISGENFVLLKCCSQYPSDYESMKLETIGLLKSTFNCQVGLSDHSPGFLGAIIAVAKGATVIEKHICISRNDDVVDAKFSMEPYEFKEMVVKIRDTESILGTPSLEPSIAERKSIINRRSLYVCKAIVKGEMFSENNIRSVRPSLGLPPKYLSDIIGKKAICDIEFGTPLSWNLVE